MIATTDIANILYKDCAAAFNGFAVVQEGNIPNGTLKGGRVVIHVKEQTPEKIWKKCFAEVNILIPDKTIGVADLVRLNEIERIAARLAGSGNFDGTPYRYSVASTKIMEEEKLKCHFVNTKILFQAINTIEQ